MCLFTDMISGSKPTLVDFFASWCGPCKMQTPILEKLKEIFGDTANIVKIDIDHERALAAQHHVQSVPTLVIFKNGTIVWRGVGVHQLSQLEAKLREYTD